MKKIFLIFTIFVLIMNTFVCVTSFADDFSDGIGNVKAASKSDATNAVNSTEKAFATVIAVLRIVALGLAVIMMLVLAVKYMTAAPNEKVSFWKSAMIYVVGAVLLFGTSEILALLEDFAANEIN